MILVVLALSREAMAFKSPGRQFPGDGFKVDVESRD